jgi:hypothetical protein
MFQGGLYLFPLHSLLYWRPWSPSTGLWWAWNSRILSFTPKCILLFTALYACYDFFANFRCYLRYDIHLQQAFVHNHTFNPAHWQTKVYEAVSRDYDSRSSSTSLPSGSHAGAQSSFFRSDSVPKNSTSNASHSFSLPFTQHKCIFCGKAECHGHACSTVKTAYITFNTSTSIFMDSAGEQVCYCFNGARGCKVSKSDYGRQHLCI